MGWSLGCWRNCAPLAQLLARCRVFCHWNCAIMPTAVPHVIAHWLATIWLPTWRSDNAMENSLGARPAFIWHYSIEIGRIHTKHQNVDVVQRKKLAVFKTIRAQHVSSTIGIGENRNSELGVRTTDRRLRKTHGRSCACDSFSALIEINRFHSCCRREKWLSENVITLPYVHII